MRRLVHWLVRLFPARFRDTFEADMRATFEDRWREGRSIQLAARTVADLAISAALERFSEPRKIRRKGDSRMSIAWQNFRFAVRTLGKSPGFTLVALITLALGIGVNTAMFSVANAVLWRSLPYPNPAGIVWVGEVDGKNPDSAWGASYLNYRDWQARAHSFDAMAVILRADKTLTHGADRSRVVGSGVTREFFEILGVQPNAGRAIAASDEKPGAAPVIVLSDHMWRASFGGDPSILGRSIPFDDSAYTVIGIMPEQFEHGKAEFWVPLQPVMDPYFATHRDVWVMEAIARLRAGQTVAAAQTEMAAIEQQILAEHPESIRGLVMHVAPLQAHAGRDLRPALLVLLGAVGVVLLIACANLAGLMSVRASARGREMAIRSALGAGRGNLIGQLLTECVTLSLAGGLAGIALAAWATRALQWLSKDPRLAEVSIDFRVLMFALTVTLATSLLFGVAPALRSARTDAGEAMKSGTRSGAGPRRVRARQVLVIAQVALCLVLLMGAGLLFRSLRRVLEMNPGFRTDHVSSMRIRLPDSYKTIAAVTQVYGQLIDRLRSMPGVTDAALVNSLPISGGDSTGDLTIEGRAAAVGELGGVTFRSCMPGYFGALGIPFVRGRDFTESDDRQHEAVTIIADSMARRFWPGENPIGRRIKVGPRDTAKWNTIVGVVRDVRNIGLDSEPGFATYTPVAQSPRLEMEAAIRTAGDPQTILAAAQRELRRIEPGLLIDRVRTMSQRIDDSVAPRRLNLVLFGLFAALALVLAGVGLYGVVAYAAGQRTREFGIRMALGARSADVLRLVLGQGLRLAAAGIAIGVAAALGLTRLLTKLLFGVEPADPLTLGTVAVVLAAVAMLACWLPARRATRIAPTEALRTE